MTYYIRYQAIYTVSLKVCNVRYILPIKQQQDMLRQKRC